MSLNRDEPARDSQHPGRRIQDAAGLGKLGGRETGHLPAESVAGQGVDVVEIDDAVVPHPVGLSGELEVGHESALRVGEGSDEDRADAVGDGT